MDSRLSRHPFPSTASPHGKPASSIHRNIIPPSTILAACMTFQAIDLMTYWYYFQISAFLHDLAIDHGKYIFLFHFSASSRLRTTIAFRLFKYQPWIVRPMERIMKRLGTVPQPRGTCKSEMSIHSFNSGLLSRQYGFRSI